MNRVVYSLLLLTLAACGTLRNEVSPSLLTTESEKLVVNGYISPQDTVVVVKVSRSKPVLGEQSDALPFNIADASVSISNGQRVVVLPYISASQWYQVSARLLPIQQGQTYTVTVTTPDGKSVTASATVPSPVAINQVVIDSTTAAVTLNNRIQKTYTVQFDWADPTGQPNYYEYVAYFNWSPGSAYPGIGQTSSSASPVRLLTFPREGRTGNLIADDGLDGTLLSTPVATVGVVDVTNNANAANVLRTLTLSRVFPGARVRVQLLHTDAVYYRYTDAIIRQRETRNNPFAEPVLIPSNVRGGLGCFAAYNRSERIVRIR